VNCDVVRLIALDEILRLFLGGAMYVALKLNVGDNFLDDDAANSPGLRVPCDTIAKFERLRHLSLIATERKMHPAMR